MLLLFCFRTEEFYEFVHIKIHWFELHIWCDCVWIVTKVGFKKDHIFPNHRFVVIIAIFPIEWISKLWNPSNMCVIQTLSPKVLTLYLFGVFMCVFFSLFLCVCYMSLNVLFEMRFFFRPQYLYVQRRITFFVPLLANKNIIEMPMARRMSTIFYWYHIYAIWSHTRIDFEFQNRMTEQIKNYEQKSSTYIEEFLSCIIRDKLIDIEFAGVLIENYWWAIKKWLLALFSRINAYCEKKYAYWRDRQMLLLCGESTVVWINRKLKWLFLVTFLWFWIR